MPDDATHAAPARRDPSHADLLAAFPDIADPAATESWLRGAGDLAPSSDVIPSASTPLPSAVVSPVTAQPPASAWPAEAGKADGDGAAGGAGGAGGSKPPRRRKPNRWDRPKEPHDWRWVVGLIGRSLIITGLLIFAFVAYQLWGTGIQTAQSQNRLENDFEQMLASATTLPRASDTTTATTLPPVTTLSPVTTPQTTVAAPTATTVAPGTAAPTTEAPTTTPPTAPATTAPPAVIERPSEGEVVGKIDIPKIGVENLFFVEGVARDDLHKGPGHFPTSSFPGQLGNAAIAGHRTTYGAPFYDLDKLEPGDQIIVTTLAGTYVYVVTGSEVVKPNEYAKVVPTFDPNLATLTLATCTPVHTSTHRLIVRATLDAAQSAVATQPSASPTEAGTVDTVVEIPGDEPADTSPSVSVSASVEPQPSTTAAGASTTVAAAPSEPSTSVVASAAAVEQSQEAFGGGWFDDGDAWPDVVLWGLALITISVGGYFVSRAARRYWVGALVAVAPFTVVLYFWFENVNRLLPPGL